MTREKFHLDTILGGTDLPAHIPFRAYMDAAMFDPEHGYYGSGRVRFGERDSDDYWTFPARLSPWFGKLLARRVVELWRSMRAAAGERAFQLVEVGGGMGQLLIDTVGGIADLAAQGDADADALSARLELVALDRSPALLDQQAASQGQLTVRHVNAGADELAAVLSRPFLGVVFANELLTQMSVDVLRVSADGAGALAVLPWLAEPLRDLTIEPPPTTPPSFAVAGLRPLDPAKLSALMGRLADDDALRARFSAREIARWSGTLVATSDEARRYLAFAAPAVRRLRSLERLPIWVTHLAPLPRVVSALGELLRDGNGAFVTVDYGGTLHHVFDPGSKLPHFRTFSHSEGETPSHDPFRAPGAEDMTTDLDFSHLVHLAAAEGLELAFYGHQAALESGADLWGDPAIKRALIDGRIAEGFAPMQAGLEAWRMIKELRGAGGFRLVALTSPGLGDALAALGPSDPVRVADLPDLPRDLPREVLVERIARALPDGHPAGLAAILADVLRAGGSVVDDLADAGHYAYRHAVLAAIDAA